jgi:hypothetical protein
MAVARRTMWLANFMLAIQFDGVVGNINNRLKNH